MGLCCGNLTSAPKSMLARGVPAGVARGVVIGVVRGVDTFRWGFSGSHMRCSMKPRRSAGRLMRATLLLDGLVRDCSCHLRTDTKRCITAVSISK